MIGVFGGTFDPVHFGHLRIALDTLQQLQLEQVRFIPCGEPPHRDKPVATALQRLAMVRAAVARQDKFVVDDREIQRQGSSYMFDTLSSLKQDYPGKSFCLMLGSDAFNAFNRWHRYQDIFELASIAVMERPGSDAQHGINSDWYQQVQQRVVTADQFCKSGAGKVCFVPVTQLEISASRIRTLWQQGQDVQFFLPDDVITIIQQQQIYQVI